MEIPELLEACEKTYAVMGNAREIAQSEGDVAKALYYDGEMIKTEDTINKLRSTIGKEPLPHPEPNFDMIVNAVVERLKPPVVTAPVEVVPAELKMAVGNVVKLLDTITEGDGIKFFGSGLTSDKKAEVKQVQDELNKWVK
jgi:hypothetical protein